MIPAAPQQIYDATEGVGIPVDILIDNAGLGQFGAFVQNPVEQELSQVRVNCEAVVHMARLFVPRMIERRRGWVLITASTASFQPLPYFSTYAATKAFDRFFAIGLAHEVARFGVKVTALCPGPTESEFFDVARAGVMRRGMQSAEDGGAHWDCRHGARQAHRHSQHDGTFHGVRGTTSSCRPHRLSRGEVCASR